MARLFDDGSSQYLKNNSAVFTGYPVSFSIWMYADDISVSSWTIVLCAENEASSLELAGLQFRGADAGDKVTIQEDGNERASTTTGVSANTWHHVAGYVAGGSGSAVWLDGGSKATGSSNGWAGAHDTFIGALGISGSVSSHFSGRLAEAALWFAQLTDAEVAALAAGYSPLMVRPQSLGAYWPLIGNLSPEIDIVGGYDMTLQNAPTKAAHPPIIYPQGLIVPEMAYVAPPSTALYRRRLIFAG